MRLTRRDQSEPLAFLQVPSRPIIIDLVVGYGVAADSAISHTGSVHARGGVRFPVPALRVVFGFFFLVALCLDGTKGCFPLDPPVRIPRENHRQSRALRSSIQTQTPLLSLVCSWSNSHSASFNSNSISASGSILSHIYPDSPNIPSCAPSQKPPCRLSPAPTRHTLNQHPKPHRS